MGQVTASLTVNFNATGAGAGAGATMFSAEIDSRPNGYNLGNTSFYPNDSVYMLLYKGALVSNVTHQQSSGTVAFYTTTTVDIVEDVTLAMTREFSTSRPYLTTPSIAWYGTSPGAVSEVGDGSTLTVPAKCVAAGKITYKANADVYVLNNVPQAYPVAVVVFLGDTP